MHHAYKDDDGIYKMGEDGGMTIDDVSFVEEGGYVIGEVDGRKIKTRIQSGDVDRAKRLVCGALRTERARMNPVNYQDDISELREGIASLLRQEQEAGGIAKDIDVNTLFKIEHGQGEMPGGKDG